MNQIILIGCLDSPLLAEMSTVEGVEAISYEEAAQRGLAMPFNERVELELAMREPFIPGKEPLPFHGYQGKRPGRRPY